MQDRASDRLTAYKTTNVTRSTMNSVLENATANLTIPQGCHVVLSEEMDFLPWDNPDNIITAEVENIIRRIKDILIPIFFLIGGPANVISLAVFYKQGLKERFNLCLFALSLADELFLIETMLLFGEQIHVQFTSKERFGPVLRSWPTTTWCVSSVSLGFPRSCPPSSPVNGVCVSLVPSGSRLCSELGPWLSS